VQRSYKRSLVLAALVTVAAGIIWYVSRPEPVAVLVEPAKRGTVARTVANTRAGTVKACRRAKLSPSVGGQISRLTVEEGDQVSAGQLLMELWNEDLKAQVMLANSEARAARAKAHAACAQSDLAQREAERVLRLHQDQLVSEEQADRALAEVKVHHAECRAAFAQAKVALANVHVAMATLDRTRLRAPFAGVIAEITGELDEYTTPSPPGIPTPPAIDLIDNNCFYVSAPIDEIDAAAIEVGMPARITLDAFGEREFSGTIERIAAYVLDFARQARTVDVKAEFNDRKDYKRLLAGYTADVEVILKAHANTLYIPTEAVVDHDKVLIFNPQSHRLERRRIVTGISNWNRTEVRSGLVAGEQVVISLNREAVQAGAYASVDVSGEP
jgi:HlyD family secretion protein